MNIINRKQLVDNLQKISGPTLSKSTFPIFSTVLLEFLDKKLRFTTTDLEMTMQSEMDQECTSQDSFCVSLKKLLSILKEFNSEEVKLEVKKNFLWITCENCEFKLNILPYEEFPKVPTFKDKHMIKISSDVLKEMIDMTSFCVFVGEGSYVLSGILCEIEKNKVRMVSTDGKRLALSERDLPVDQPEFNTLKRFIIPYKTVMELSKLIKSTDEEYIHIISGKNQIGFEFQDLQFISQLIEGDFPDYKKYILKEAESKCTVDRKLFFSALKKANLLTSNDFKGVKLEYKKDSITVSKVTPQLGEFKEDIVVDYKGSDVTIGFNPDYLLDVLKVLDSNEIVMDIYAEEKPVVFRKQGYLYLALPMRLT